MSLVDQNMDPAATRRYGSRVVVYGIAAIVAILLVAAVLLFMNLPDANAFRPDQEERFEALPELLAQAPDLRERYFRVPRIID